MSRSFMIGKYSSSGTVTTHRPPRITAASRVCRREHRTRRLGDGLLVEHDVRMIETGRRRRIRDEAVVPNLGGENRYECLAFSDASGPAVHTPPNEPLDGGRIEIAGGAQCSRRQQLADVLRLMSPEKRRDVRGAI